MTATITGKPFVSPTLINKAADYYHTKREREKESATRVCLSTITDTKNSRAILQSNNKAVSNASKRSAYESPIEIWNAKNASSPVLLGKKESELYGIACTNFKNLKSSDMFFRTIYGRPPINTSDQLIKSYIHHPQAENNALYDPVTRCIYYGDVEPELFTSLIDNPEITTHELGHAVTDFSSGLVYQSQSGALDESLADVFGIIHKHYSANIRAGDLNASWLIGEGVVAYPDGINQSLRSMSHPGKAYLNHPILDDDPQPSHMRSYVTTTDDYGGVHINSGIPNHAFYLAATREGGYSWNKIGQIWFEALISCEPNEQFSGFANRTISFSKKYSEPIVQIVAKAWSDVGINVRMPQAVQPTNLHSRTVQPKRDLNGFMSTAAWILFLGVVAVMLNKPK